MLIGIAQNDVFLVHFSQNFYKDVRVDTAMYE